MTTGEGGMITTNDDELADHYRVRQWDTNCRTISEYDASARATIRNGIRFTYNEKDSIRRAILS